MPIIGAMHNKKLLQEDQQDQELPGCNCQGGPAVCPVQGRCLTKGVIYRATVTDTESGQVETYTGVTGNTLKSRPFSIEWKLVDRGTRFNPTNKKCRICLEEKKETG